MASEREFEIQAGRREADGHVRLSIFAGQLLALTVEGTAERAPTLLLTREQAQSLLAALSGLIPLLEEVEEKRPAAQGWPGRERRMSGELNG
ncbi:MAG TPA: hypothetical protein VGB17_19535 [Pyrinomonadaceae bacterium]|jgi:hypothetical protein